MKQCPFCREMLQDDAVKCPHCGSSLYVGPSIGGNNNAYRTDTPPRFAPGYEQNAGYDSYSRRNNAFDEGPEGKSRGVCALLAILLGNFGVQYFYLGKTTAGIIALVLGFVSCGLWSILTLIQGVMMFMMNNEDFRRKYVLSDSTFPLF